MPKHAQPRRPQHRPLGQKVPPTPPAPLIYHDPERNARIQRMLFEAESAASGRPPKPACQLPR
jgi:hypothetical protein